MFPPTPVLLVADDPLARSGIAALLPEELPVVGAVSPDVDVDAAAAAAGAEVVIWHAPDALPARGTTLPVVVLVRDAEAADRALARGANGVLRRDAGSEQLAAAVLGVRHGLRVVDDRFARAPTAEAPGPTEGPREALTVREAEVLELLAEGRSNREIGTALDISPHTAKFHVDRLLAKLDASSRTDAVVRAVRMGLLVL